MKNFGMALSEIVERRYRGNRSALAKLINVSPSTIYRFCSGEMEPAMDSLEALCDQLPPEERKRLLVAAARDRIPSAYQDELFGSDEPAPSLFRARLSPDLAAVIRYLEGAAMKDESTAAYLRKIGEWVGLPLPPDPLKISEKGPASSRKTEEEPEAAPPPAGPGARYQGARDRK